MERRVLLAGMGALMTAPMLLRPAFAQDAAQPMPGQAVDANQTKHMQQTAMYGSLSLLTSRLAVKKAKNAKVLEFAKFEVAEQETISDILNGMMKAPTQASGKVVAPSDDEAMSHVDDQGRAILSKLNGVSGAQFDAEFVKGQVDTHKKLLSIQKDYLDSGSNREELSVAKLAKGMIEEHLQLLSDIEKMLKI